MDHAGGRASAAPRAWGTRALPWASLLPLLLLLRPYGGLIQDARIYLGRGLADLRPDGLGRDVLFADDPQTGYSLMRPVMRALLGRMTAGEASMLLVALGLLLWLAAAVVLVRSLTARSGPARDAAAPLPGLAAWAGVVAVLALPAGYGAFGIFGYAEAIATPRIFAEAAVLAGLAALVRERRAFGLAWLALALALHPLMALPGLGIAAVLLVRDDRRWLLALAAGAAGLVGAAALGFPLVGRLVVPMDEAWSSILRARSLNLFPSLWPAEAYARIACRVAAVLMAGSLLPGRPCALLWGTAAVALAGVAASLTLGDLAPRVLVVQSQPWRALWPLAVLGNAGLVLAAVASWRRGRGAALAAAVLVAAWCAETMPLIAVPLSLAALALHAADRRGLLDAVAPRALRWAGAFAVALLAQQSLGDGVALARLLRATGDGAGQALWPYVVGSGVLAMPLALGAAALALAPRLPRPRWAGGLAAAAAGTASLAGLLLWDSRTAERRMVDAGGGAAELAAALGPAPGEVLWIDDDSGNWFLAGRPAFFDALHGAPILFSRALALDWADRARTLRGLGLARAADVAPWSAKGGGAEELALAPASVGRFCADARHPAALVAPGAQLGAVPAGLAAALWRPPVPFRRLVAGDGGGFRWRRVDAFTVVRCAGPAGAEASLGSVRID